MPFPSTLPPRAQRRISYTPRLIYDWRAEDYSLVPRTGQAPTFSRAGPGVLVDVNGRPITAAQGQPRFGVQGGLAHLLLEVTRTNTLINSKKLASGGWGAGATTATEAANVAPDGTLTGCYIQDTVANSTHYRSQTIANTAGEWLAFSCFLHAGTHSKVLWTLVDSGTTTGVQYQVDLAAGTLSNAIILGTGSVGIPAFMIPVYGGWYYLAATIRLDAATSTTGSMFFYNVGGNSFANSVYVGDASNILGVWQCQIERLGTTQALAASSPIETAGAPVTRVQDFFNFPALTLAPQPMWYYLKFIEAGTALQNNSRVLSIGKTEQAVNTAFLLQGSNGYNISHNNGVSGVASTLALGTAMNDVVEILGLLFPDGHTQGRGVKNLGAEVIANASGALALAAAWDNNGVLLNESRADGIAADMLKLCELKVGLGNTINTVPLARAA